MAEFLAENLYVNLLEEVVDTFRTHLCDELVRIGIGKVIVALKLGENVEVLVFGKQFHLVDAALS